MYSVPLEKIKTSKYLIKVILGIAPKIWMKKFSALSTFGT
jgi:hypothetical protein